MHEVSQQQKQTSPNLLHGSDKEHIAAQLEKALQVEPQAANLWCRLGELYDALAREASDRQTASAYRDKAIAALTQAIGLSPSLGKAHYALAGVYEAQDKCLALVELEAAAKCDPEAYAGALARAQKAVRDCTYRLADLNVVALDSAQSKPGPEILQAEFYFEDRPVRSAVLQSCVSDGSRQSARFWLFESAEPHIGADAPVAQLAVSSTGNVFLSKGSLANYQPKMAIPVSVPPHAQRGRSVVLPIALMIVVFGGSLFAYLSLIAPVADVSDEPAMAAAAAPKANREPRAPAADEVPGDAAPPSVSSALPRLASTAPPQPEAPSPPSITNSQPARLAMRPVEAPDALKAQPRATPGIARREAQKAEPRRPTQQPAASTARDTPARLPVDPPVGSSATQISTVELKPVIREAPPVAPAPMKEQLTSAPPTPSERLASARPVLNESSVSPPVPNERLAMSRPAPGEEPGAASLPAKQPSTPENTWVRRMRAALDACGRPGYLRSDVCRETVRWNHCHPNRWGTVRECTVERFASSGGPE